MFDVSFFFLLFLFYWVRTLRRHLGLGEEKIFIWLAKRLNLGLKTFLLTFYVLSILGSNYIMNYSI